MTMGTKSKSFALVIITLFFASLVILHPVNSQSEFSQITILADGSIVGTNKIHQNGNIYTLTGNLNNSIIIEKDNIVLDGAGFILQGPENLNLQETGVSLNGKIGVVIENLRITGFNIDIALTNSSKCKVSGNEIYGNNNQGIVLNNSRNNWIKQNDVEETEYNGVVLLYSNDTFVTQNKILNSSGAGIYVEDKKSINFLSGTNNIISENILDKCGIHVEAFNNTIIGNTITNSGSGISLFLQASMNLVLKNNIFNCTIAIFLGGDDNILFENKLSEIYAAILNDYI